MKTISITVPVQRIDVNEQAFVYVDVELCDNAYGISRIEDENGNDITHLYSDSALFRILNDIHEYVIQERDEFLVRMIESQRDR
jgi:hypothetical protein